MTQDIAKPPCGHTEYYEHSPDCGFEAFDRLERKPLADNLTALITQPHGVRDAAFVLSLNAEFGAGKTAFLRMWAHDLKAQGHTVININAWETDYARDPLIAILHALLESKTIKANASLRKSLVSAMGAGALSMGNDFIQKIIGIDIPKAAEAGQEVLQDKNLEAMGKALHDDFSKRKAIYTELKKSLKAYIDSLKDKSLIILVDELDRARPDYAIQFLEAIKHIFAVPGLSFVLAVNREQLEASVKNLYGDIDFDGYYRRFATREVKLPEITKINNLKPFMEAQVSIFFEQVLESRGNFLPNEDIRNETLTFISMICIAFSLTLRDIQHLFRMLFEFVSNKKNDAKLLDIFILRATVSLTALGMKKASLYKKIGTGNLPMDDLIKYLESLNYDKFHINKFNDSEAKKCIIFTFCINNMRTNDDHESTENREILKKYNNVYYADPVNNRPYPDLSTLDVFYRFLMFIPHQGDNRPTGSEFIYQHLEFFRPYSP